MYRQFLLAIFFYENALCALFPGVYEIKPGDMFYFLI